MAARDDKLKQIRRLLKADVSFEYAFQELNDPHNFPTPRSIIESVLHCVRQRGVVALKDPENIERLSRCDKDAMAQINQHIEKLKAAGRLK